MDAHCLQSFRVSADQLQLDPRQELGVTRAESDALCIQRPDHLHDVFHRVRVTQHAVERAGAGDVAEFGLLEMEGGTAQPV